MPRNQFQRMIFALLTVIITVHGYVFYSLYVVNGATLMEVTGQKSVLDAISAQGGVYMLWSSIFVTLLTVKIMFFYFCSYRASKGVL